MTPEERALRWRRVVLDRIGAARSGDRESARWLMCEYTRAVELGFTPVREIVVYVATAFTEILEGETPEDALNLKRQRGSQIDRDAPQIRNRDMLLAALVLREKERTGSLKQAATNVAENLKDKSAAWLTAGAWSRAQDRERTIQEAWKRFGAEVQRLNPDWTAEILTWADATEAPSIEFFADLAYDEHVRALLPE
ncbi:hypothetical protein [Thiocapsa rosea]|uniref:Uncharacterized protein n=1 Tax=Thiocapsa rosea TaxID=69360 RepID=A0A495VDS1_9GAMM|nr:hypothetical protein [Thiocapsa rosea]RKT47489.1 hypothetical protein BDD21_5079 [Thiocapsa rosea]